MKLKNLAAAFGYLIIYGTILSGVAYLLSFGIAHWFALSFIDTYFIVGIVLLIVGIGMSMQGNASGSRNYGSSNPAEMMADIEALRIEREATKYYQNFTKHSVLDFSYLSLSVALAGLVTVVASVIFA